MSFSLYQFLKQRYSIQADPTSRSSNGTITSNQVHHFDAHHDNVELHKIENLIMKINHDSQIHELRKEMIGMKEFLRNEIKKELLNMHENLAKSHQNKK